MQITSDWDRDSAAIDLGLGVRLPYFINIAVRDWHGFDIDIQTEFGHGRYRVASLTMRLAHRVATQEELPDLPIRYLVDSGTFAVVLDYLPRGTPERKRGTPSHERLLAIAKMYKVAAAVGAPPRKMIANLHGVSISTAGRWIALARAKEMLSDADISAGGRPSSGGSLWDGPGGTIAFGPDSWEGFSESLNDGGKSPNDGPRKADTTGASVDDTTSFFGGGLASSYLRDNEPEAEGKKRRRP